ncbi:MAG: gamma-glutamylcyclotransferase [Rhodospirillales bacterium]|jgi:cation transport protein ChaC|nr:gamma-glutamylcyclotransferase [Rhodospirillales bacterium]MDP6804147.1 gamma-glutamylcyclotransferase [Rhodospirillales bacterium]
MVQTPETWVFAYGSLMWRPGFPYLRCESALLRGYHRAFCVLSTTYRGTPKKPGLVLGLDRGGSCRGRAFKIAAKRADSVLAYLWERELDTNVYEPKWLPVATPVGEVRACAFVVDRLHAHYTGRLANARIAEIVASTRGNQGTAHEYLENTVAHLDSLGIREGALHRILEEVRALVAERGARR